MNCATIRQDDLIERYLCHQLDESASDLLETHMLGCPDCSRLLEDLQNLRSELEERAAIIRAAAPKQKRFLFWLPTVATASAVVLVGLALVHLWKVTRKPLAVATLARPRPEIIPPEVKPAPEFDASRATPSQRMEGGDRITRLPSGPSVRTPSETPVGGSPAAGSEEQPVTQPPPAVQETPSALDNGAERADNAKTNYVGPGNQQRLTVEQGVELYRLGMVRAPAYTFSGVVAGEKLPGSDKSNSYSSKEIQPGPGRVLFQNAMSAYVDGRYNEASDFLENAARVEPTSPDINFYLGVCRLLGGHPEESVSPLMIAVAAGNSPFLQSSHYYLAKAYIRTMRLAEAETELRKAIEVPGQLTADARALLPRVQVLRAQIDKK